MEVLVHVCLEFSRTIPVGESVDVMKTMFEVDDMVRKVEPELNARGYETDDWHVHAKVNE